MANVDAPCGLKPLEYLSGAPWNGQARKYYVNTASSNLFVGDPVMFAGSADATGVFATVDKATLAATNSTIGPIVSFAPDPTTGLEQMYMASGDSGYVWVADDPNLIFEAQCDSGSTLAVGDIGGNAILIETHAGNTVTGISGLEVDETSAAGADATQMLLILGLVDRPDNTLAEHCKVRVLISMHAFAQARVGG